MTKYRFGGVAVTFCLLLGRIAGAQSTLNIAVNEKAPTYTIAEEYTGLSYEMQAVLPDQKGQHLFRADNAPLIAIFRTLGIRTLRLGGVSADSKSAAVPSEKDLDDLFGFAKAAGVRIMFTLRLRDGDLAAATKLAKYVLDHYEPQMICFSVGNEPNLYISDYAGYVDTFKKYVTTIRVVLPESRFCGPGTTVEALGWTGTFASEFNNRNFAVVVTYHDYPGGDPAAVKDPAEGRKALLSSGWMNEAGQKAQTLTGAFRQGFGYRLEQAASFAGAGREGASNSMAAALWGLEYLNWWAWNGCGGVNLSGGDFVVGDSGKMPNWNAPFESKDRGYSARPLAYAIKAFDLARRGRVAKLEFSGNEDKLNLSGYAILGADQNLYLTIINKENGPGARSAKASIQTAQAYARAEFLRLESPDNDPAATSGVTLGGARISEDGGWNGQWAPLQTTNLSATVAPASAIVIRLLPK